MAEVKAAGELRLKLPDLDCLEYLFDVDGTLVPDPGNPDRVEGAFGPHSWLALPGYRPPGWLDAEAAPGSRHELTVGEIGIVVWEPAGHEGAPLPLLLVHDGAEMDEYGGVVRVRRHPAAHAGRAAGARQRPRRPLRRQPGVRRRAGRRGAAGDRRRLRDPRPAGAARPDLGALAALHAAWTHRASSRG